MTTTEFYFSELSEKNGKLSENIFRKFGKHIFRPFGKVDDIPFSQDEALPSTTTAATSAYWNFCSEQ